MEYQVRKQQLLDMSTTTTIKSRTSMRLEQADVLSNDPHSRRSDIRDARLFIR